MPCNNCDNKLPGFKFLFSRLFTLNISTDAIEKENPLVFSLLASYFVFTFLQVLSKINKIFFGLHHFLSFFSLFVKNKTPWHFEPFIIIFHNCLSLILPFLLYRLSCKFKSQIFKKCVRDTLNAMEYNGSNNPTRVQVFILIYQSSLGYRFYNSIL